MHVNDKVSLIDVGVRIGTYYQVRTLLQWGHAACRALLTQEGICLTLSPEFHFLEVAYPYVARRLLTAEDPILRERLFQVSCIRLTHKATLQGSSCFEGQRLVFHRVVGAGSMFRSVHSALPKLLGAAQHVSCLCVCMAYAEIMMGAPCLHCTAAA